MKELVLIRTSLNKPPLKYAIKSRRSKAGFFQFTHEGNKVRLCHFPCQTSARVCLALRLLIKPAHTEPPCISASYHDHPHTHTTTHSTMHHTRHPLLKISDAEVANFSSLHKYSACRQSCKRSHTCSET